MNNKALRWGLLILLAAIWGGSFILMKRAMFTNDLNPSKILTPNQVAALRIAIAGFVLLPFTIISLRKKEVRQKIHLFSVVGGFGNLIPAFLFTFAGAHIASSFSGMLNSFTPLFTLMLGVFFFKQTLLKHQIFGVFIAIVGAFILMYFNPKSGNSNVDLIYPIAVIFATFLYGISLNTIKHKLSRFKSMEITSMGFGLVFLPALILCFYTGAFTAIATHPRGYEALGYVAVLAIIGTALAVFLYNRIIAISSAVFASTVTYLIPAFALVYGYLDSEPISPMQLVGMCIIILGILFANDILLKKR